VPILTTIESLLAQQNPAQNKERRKQVRTVVGFVPGDSVPADEAAIGLPEFEERDAVDLHKLTP
jgi:hypothetical protein